MPIFSSNSSADSLIDPRATRQNASGTQYTHLESAAKTGKWGVRRIGIVLRYKEMSENMELCAG